MVKFIFFRPGSVFTIFTDGNFIQVRKQWVKEEENSSQNRGTGFPGVELSIFRDWYFFRKG